MQLQKGMVAHIFKPSTQEAKDRQIDLCESEARLVYISKPAKTKNETLSQNKKTKKNRSTVLQKNQSGLKGFTIAFSISYFFQAWHARSHLENTVTVAAYKKLCP